MSFSQEDYQRYDPRAKATAARFFSINGYNVRVMKGVGPDVKISKDGATKYVETEVKAGWKAIRFPFPNMRVASRKELSEADIFIQFNATYTAFAMCPMSVVIASPKSKPISTKRGKNETFYEVDLNKLTFYKKTGVRVVDPFYPRLTEIVWELNGPNKMPI